MLSLHVLHSVLNILCAILTKQTQLWTVRVLITIPQVGIRIVNFWAK